MSVRYTDDSGSTLIVRRPLMQMLSDFALSTKIAVAYAVEATGRFDRFERCFIP